MSGFVTAMVAIGVAATGIGVTAYQGEKQSNAIKKAANAAADANNKAIKEAQLAQDTAASQAQAQIDARRKRVTANNTIFTNPLGIQDQAAIAKKSLLGQ